jgi:hypothetical protein
MKQEPFLVDDKPVQAFLLAWIPYLRPQVAKIAEGENPGSFRMKSNELPTWGLLYIGNEEIGFFVHASENPMAAMVRGASGGGAVKEIVLRVPFSSITKAEFPPAIEKRGLRKILKWLTPREEDRFTLAWKPAKNETGSPVEIEFFIAANTTAFRLKLEEVRNRLG